MHVVAAVALATFVVAAWRLTRPDFAERFVPPATPEDLGRIRVLVGVILLASAVWEDLPRSALMPRALILPMGVLQFLYKAHVGFDRLVASVAGLTVFKWVTAAALLAATLGWRTRVSVPVAAALILVYHGILRQYFFFNHAGLVAILVLIVLSFTPCGDAWSLDRRRRERQGLLVAPAGVGTWRYGWARYACWTLLAVLYVEAGLSKIRNGGWFWWDPTNLRYIYYRCTLDPMNFGWRLAIDVGRAPDAVFAAFGIFSILAEVAYGSVLVSRLARRVMPLVMVAFHLAVWVFQNLLFLDLILLQAIFVTPRARATATQRAGVGGPLLVAAIAAVLLGCYAKRVEWYPLTSMQMFSGRHRTPVVDYYKLVAHHADCSAAPADLSHCRFRWAATVMLLKRAFDPARRAPLEEFLAGCAAGWNESAPPARAWRTLEVQRWRWNFGAQPADPDLGAIADRWVMTVAEDGVHQ